MTEKLSAVEVSNESRLEDLQTDYHEPKEIQDYDNE